MRQKYASSTEADHPPPFLPVPLPAVPTANVAFDVETAPLSGIRPRSTAEVRLVIHPSRATLLVACPAFTGLSLALFQALASSGAEMLEAEQLTRPNCQRFFQRIHCDISRSAGTALLLERALGQLSQQFGLSIACEAALRRKRVALFVSKYDHCLRDLLLRARAGELACDIPLVISNHPDLAELAAEFGASYACVHKSAADKHRAEQQERALLAEHDVDLIVLARYMQVLSADFVARFPQRIINIHHSLLPAFPGGKPYHQAHLRGVKLIGATAHYVTAELDEGPIIEQDVARCDHNDSIDDLLSKGRDLERTVLARAVRYHVEDRILLDGPRTIVFG